MADSFESRMADSFMTKEQMTGSHMKKNWMTVSPEEKLRGSSH